MDMFTVYINLQCVGFSRRSVDKERTRAISNDVLMGELFNRMGFLNKEYLDYLPGHSSQEEIYTDWDGDYINWFGEDEFSMTMTHGLRIDFETIEIDSFMRSYHSKSPRATLCRWIDEKLNEAGMYLFLMQPTTQDVIDGWNYTKYPNYDEMWFCSDWKDPDDSIDKETLTEMDHSIANLKKGIVSSEIDLSDFEEE